MSDTQLGEGVYANREGPWNSFAMLFLSNFGTGDCVEGGGTAAACEDEVGVAETGGGRLVAADFAASDPLFCHWTATEPKDLTRSASLTAGAAAGEEEIGATASSIEPKVTTDPG
jgi:hypothetical protein